MGLGWIWVVVVDIVPVFLLWEGGGNVLIGEVVVTFGCFCGFPGERFA